jgi:hypothetical protein
LSEIVASPWPVVLLVCPAAVVVRTSLGSGICTCAGVVRIFSLGSGIGTGAGASRDPFVTSQVLVPGSWLVVVTPFVNGMLLDFNLEKIVQVRIVHTLSLFLDPKNGIIQCVVCGVKMLASI